MNLNLLGQSRQSLRDSTTRVTVTERLLGASLLTLGLALGATAPGWAQVKAVPSDRLLETIGVGTRFDWRYNDGDGPAVKQSINAVGFRYLRIGLGGETNDWDSYQNFYSSYANEKGLKLLLQCEGESKESLTREFNKWMERPNTIWGVEGANEKYDAESWWSSDFPNAFELQKFIYGLAQPKGLNVLTWTTGGAAIPYVENFPNPNAYCTHANFHAYSWDTHTGDGKKIIPIWEDISLNNESVSWGAHVANYGHVGGLWAMEKWTGNASKPKTITEWGYVYQAEGNESYQNIDSEASRAKYVLRNCLELVNAKVDKAFYYSLMDEHDKFGIVNRDGSLKQSGQALANLFALLKDPGHANDQTGSLNYTLTTSSGIGTSDDHYSQNSEIHQTLFQKSNGHFLLALWADKDSHKGDTGSEAATLKLNGLTASEVKLYLPLTNGTSAVQTLGAGTSSISLSGNVAIPDHPILIEITPTGGGTTPTTPTTPTTTASKQINVGGDAVSPFAADAGNSGSSATYLDTEHAVTTSGVTNAAPASVYQTGRYGTGTSFTYTIGGLTAGASHTVRLHFNEPTFDGSGQRKFHVKINGTQVLTDFDICAAASTMHKAVVKDFTATATSSGQVVIDFLKGSVDNPYVCGLEVIPAATTSTGGGLANGVYTLTSKVSAGSSLARVLDVAASNDANGRRLPIINAQQVGKATQQWTLTKQSDGYYTLTTKLSATDTRILDVVSSGKTKGTPVQLYWANNSDAQRWQIEADGTSGYYILTPKHVQQDASIAKKLRLDVAGGTNADGTQVFVWEDNGLAPQRWKLDLVPTTTPAIRSGAAPSSSAEATSLSAYPNPSPDGKASLQLQAAQAQSATVYVRDAHGQLVSMVPVPVRAGQTEWRLPSTLGPGTYFVQTTLDGQVQRFILKVE